MLPYDALQSDITTADSIQLSVNFSYDGYPMRTSEGAAEACLEAYQALGHSTLLDTFDNYLTGILGEYKIITLCLFRHSLYIMFNDHNYNDMVLLFILLRIDK